MKKLLFILLIPFTVYGQINVKNQIKKTFKFATFYGAYNGNNSVSDFNTYSVLDGLTTETTSTPYDYSAVFGLRKIQRFGYEPNIQNRFKNGTENSFSDAATVGSKSKGFEICGQSSHTNMRTIRCANKSHHLLCLWNRSPHLQIRSINFSACGR